MEEKDREYVLGSSDEEIARLAFQHETWSDATGSLWRTAGISYGDSVADLGCGPGFASLELAHLVGPSGNVAAVDASERFVSLVSSRIESLGFSNIIASKGDVTSLNLESGTFDFVFSRWLYCFLREPEQAAHEALRILKPGGKLVVMDYLNYLAAGIFPGSESLNSIFPAYLKTVNEHYGSYNIGGVLPSMLAEIGFEIVSLEPIVRIARPGQNVWRWVELFNELSVPALVENGIWTEEQKEQFESEWAAAKEDPGTFFFSPPMIGIVAEKV
ncbi:MAG TPA: methyltransferase domain-containing protein [Aridibacter sp.]|nr:methyltransferase domain-containing protein [Aridibacter sp.]